VPYFCLEYDLLDFGDVSRESSREHGRVCARILADYGYCEVQEHSFSPPFSLFDFAFIFLEAVQVSRPVPTLSPEVQIFCRTIQTHLLYTCLKYDLLDPGDVGRNRDGAAASIRLGVLTEQGYCEVQEHSISPPFNLIFDYFVIVIRSMKQDRSVF
jgi:hypothetical protein